MVDDTYDVLIAGAGLAGVLAANRICQEVEASTRVLLVDKAPLAGGRALPAQQQQGVWGTGLHFLSTKLFEYTRHSLALEPEGPGLENIAIQPVEKAAIFAAGQFTDFSFPEIFAEGAARALGGSAVEKQWSKLVSSLWLEAPEGDKDLPFAKFWKENKNHPVATVLGHFFAMAGVVNMWQASQKALGERAAFLRSGLWTGDWKELVERLLRVHREEGKLEQLYSCRIVEAYRQEKGWQIITEKGDFRARSLLVAQSPWQALEWLDRASFTPAILQFALKAKPASVVVLSVKIDTAAFPWHVVYIPSEQVQIVPSGEHSLVFQATIDFELSLDALAVVKAVKRLRRALSKITKVLPSLHAQNEHIALVPVGWTQSAAFGEGKLVAALTAPSKLESPDLGFVGDAYGGQYRPDDNIIRSITSACPLIVDYVNNSRKD